MKKNLGNKLFIKILGTSISILIFSLIFFNYIDKRISPKLNHVAKITLNKKLKNVASDFLKSSSLDNEDILKYTKNSEGEITTINFNQQAIYGMANKLTLSIKNELTDANNRLLLNIPIGMASNSPFLNNFGPKIPIGIQYIDTVFTQVKTNIQAYGINNALIEIYLDISLTYEIISPVTKENEELKYSLLIDSVIVNGVVPNLYGKTFESKTVFFNVFP